MEKVIEASGDPKPLPDLSSTSKDLVVSQIAADLREILSQFRDPKKGLKIISVKTSIHEKTLHRLINEENRASYMTIFKLYRYILDESDDAKILDLAPPVIKDYLIQTNPQLLTEQIIFSSGIDQELSKNPVFGEIYILCGTGPLSRNEILARFGQYGLNIVEKMLKQQVLKESGLEVYELGKNQANFGPESIINLGTHLALNHVKKINGDILDQNFMGLYAEGLSPEAYAQWLKIDQDAFRKKVSLSSNKNNLGTIRAFTFMTTDSLNIEVSK